MPFSERLIVTESYYNQKKPQTFPEVFLNLKVLLSVGLKLETELCAFTDQTIVHWRTPLASLAKLI